MPPADGPTASLRFSQDHAGVLFYPDETCRDARLLGTERTIKVVAEKRLYLSVTFNGALASCTAYVSFEPAMNQEYLVEYFEPDNRHCSVSVEKIGLGGAKTGQESTKTGFKC